MPDNKALTTEISINLNCVLKPHTHCMQKFNKENSVEETLDGIKASLNEVLQGTIGDCFLFENEKGKNMANAMEFKNVYYGGGTLCIDTNQQSMIMFNICDETMTIQKTDGSMEFERNLMPTKLIWFSFFIYLHTKGKTPYYMECYNKSCIRHVYSPDLEEYDFNPEQSLKPDSNNESLYTVNLN